MSRLLHSQGGGNALEARAHPWGRDMEREGQAGGSALDQEAHLEDVVPRLHIRYVNPLAVDVRIVSVIAAGAQTLGRGTGVKAGVLGPAQSHSSSLGPSFLPSRAHWVDGPDRR